MISGGFVGQRLPLGEPTSLHYLTIHAFYLRILLHKPYTAYGRSRAYAPSLHNSCTVRKLFMPFITDVQELKSGLIIFRRTDVQHRNWYCRTKVPNADRYKTVSLKTSDIHEAKKQAFYHDADMLFRVRHEVPIFNKTFAQVAKE